MTDALIVNPPVAVAPPLYFVFFILFFSLRFSCFFIRFSLKFPVSFTTLKFNFVRHNLCCLLPMALALAGVFLAD